MQVADPRVAEPGPASTRGPGGEPSTGLNPKIDCSRVASQVPVRREISIHHGKAGFPGVLIQRAADQEERGPGRALRRRSPGSCARKSQNCGRRIAPSNPGLAPTGFGLSRARNCLMSPIEEANWLARVLGLLKTFASGIVDPGDAPKMVARHRPLGAVEREILDDQSHEDCGTPRLYAASRGTVTFPRRRVPPVFTTLSCLGRPCANLSARGRSAPAAPALLKPRPRVRLRREVNIRMITLGV